MATTNSCTWTGRLPTPWCARPLLPLVSAAVRNCTSVRRARRAHLYDVPCIFHPSIANLIYLSIHLSLCVCVCVCDLHFCAGSFRVPLFIWAVGTNRKVRVQGGVGNDANGRKQYLVTLGTLHAIVFLCMAFVHLRMSLTSTFDRWLAGWLAGWLQAHMMT